MRQRCQWATSTSLSLALAASNAVTAQQQANLIHQGTTTMGVATLYSLSTASTGKVADDIDD